MALFRPNPAKEPGGSNQKNTLNAGKGKKGAGGVFSPTIVPLPSTPTATFSPSDPPVAQSSSEPRHSFWRPNWRRLGIAQAMIATILVDEFIESKIFFLTGYSWHWDTDQTGLSVYAYRNLLVRLFRPFGFQVYLTNNPEIKMSSANVLMARVGRHLGTKHKERFQKMLFTFEE